MLKKLIKLANELDGKGLREEANVIDSCLKVKEAKSWFSPSRIAEKMTPEQIADIAEKMPADKLAAIAKDMNKEKQKQIIRLLIQDPEMQALVLETLGLPAGLRDLADPLLSGLAANKPDAGAGAASWFDPSTGMPSGAPMTTEALKDLFKEVPMATESLKGLFKDDGADGSE
jgi:hypothetical protein